MRDTKYEMRDTIQVIRIHPTCSTIVENPLQISFFMQNKANVKIGKMNVSVATRKDYDKEQRTTNNERCSKQSQTKPICRKAKWAQILMNTRIMRINPVGGAKKTDWRY